MWNNCIMSPAIASDTIDRDGFRANVGIVLMRARGSCSWGGVSAAAAGSSRKGA